MEQQQNAKYAFFYMLSLVALIFMALATGMVVFQIINKNIVDVISLTSGGFSSETLKFAISAIIIASPIYFVSAWLINKNLFSGKLGRDSGIRRWLTYFILFVAAVVMIGWLIATLNSFLNGDLTLKFILKALTAIIIAAIIFSYYLYDIRRAEVKGVKNLIIQIYFYGSIAIVAAVLIAGFFFVESPALTRARKYDNAILDRFSRLDGALNSYYNENKKLPDSLETLINQPTYYLAEQDIQDPGTKVKFDYKVKSKDIYQLCANFKTSNKTQDTNDMSYYYDSRWRHDSGYQCLEQKVTTFDTVKQLPAR